VRLLAAAFTLVLAVGGVAHPRPVWGAAGVGDAGFAPLARTDGNAGAGASPSPCADSKYSLLAPVGYRWRTPLRWSFRSSSVPLGLSASSVLSVIQRAFANVTSERNDCGRGDLVSATSSYLGTTTVKPSVTANGQCGDPDGRSIVGFGTLNGYYAGYTCIWWRDGAIVEADMRLGSNTAWALSSAGCANELMMESLVTHEVGHAFGLAHVNESTHGRLTMSTYIDGLCENQEATLGDGDMDGLEALY
jgi:hypothetical protein